MNLQKAPLDFQQTAEAIAWLLRDYPQPLSWDQIAHRMHLDTGYLQQIFNHRTGVDPETFLQYFYTRRYTQRPSAASNILSHCRNKPCAPTGPSQKHTPEIEIRKFPYPKDENFTLRYSFFETLFGPVLSASCEEGLCFLGFANNPETALQELETRFPNALLQAQIDDFQKQAWIALLPDNRTASEKTSPARLILCPKGSDFQLRVWHALLNIPIGQTISYGALARRIGYPTACRAVGSAVGQNPISWLIPCHRVVRSGGAIGNYHWGTNRKAALLSWETLLYSSDNIPSLS